MDLHGDSSYVDNTSQAIGLIIFSSRMFDGKLCRLLFSVGYFFNIVRWKLENSKLGLFQK